MANKERILTLIDEMIEEAQEEPQWKTESALKCLKKELLKELEPEEPIRMHHTEHKQTDNYRCKKCGNDLYFEQRFCEACGCEVKWDD